MLQRSSALLLVLVALSVLPTSSAKSKSPSATPSPRPSVGAFRCGDGVCDAPYLRLGETCGSCPDDCGPCQAADDVTQCVEPRAYAMSFDDGPSAVSASLLASLVKLGVSATFFLIGENVAKLGSLMQAEENAGHSTLSHTYTHQNLSTLSLPDAHLELAHTNEAFGTYGCRRPTLYRPPYGEIDDTRRTLFANMGMRAILWNLDTNDWQYAVSNPAKMQTEFTSQLNTLAAGSVIHLEHDLLAESVSAVPKFVAQIKAKGYSFVTAERCMWGSSYEQHPSWVYMNRYCNDPNAPASPLALAPYAQDVRVAWPVQTRASACPVSDWSTWSACDAACGPGTQTRVRLTMPPSLVYDSACSGVQVKELRACSGAALCPTTSCSKFGPWTWWNSTAECSTTVPCGTGTQRQFRLLASAPSAIKEGTGITSSAALALDSVSVNCGPVIRTVLCQSSVCASRVTSQTPTSTRAPSSESPSVTPRAVLPSTSATSSTTTLVAPLASASGSSPSPTPSTSSPGASTSTARASTSGISVSDPSPSASTASANGSGPSPSASSTIATPVTSALPDVSTPPRASGASIPSGRPLPTVSAVASTSRLPSPSSAGAVVGVDPGDGSNSNSQVTAVKKKATDKTFTVALVAGIAGVLVVSSIVAVVVIRRSQDQGKSGPDADTGAGSGRRDSNPSSGSGPARSAAVDVRASSLLPVAVASQPQMRSGSAAAPWHVHQWAPDHEANTTSHFDSDSGWSSGADISTRNRHPDSHRAQRVHDTVLSAAASVQLSASASQVGPDEFEEAVTSDSDPQAHHVGPVVRTPRAVRMVLPAGLGNSLSIFFGASNDQESSSNAALANAASAFIGAGASESRFERNLPQAFGSLRPSLFKIAARILTGSGGGNKIEGAGAGAEKSTGIPVSRSQPALGNHSLGADARKDLATGLNALPVAGIDTSRPKIPRGHSYSRDTSRVHIPIRLKPQAASSGYFFGRVGAEGAPMAQYASHAANNSTDWDEELSHGEALQPGHALGFCGGETSASHSEPGPYSSAELHAGAPARANQVKVQRNMRTKQARGPRASAVEVPQTVLRYITQGGEARTGTELNDAGVRTTSTLPTSYPTMFDRATGRIGATRVRWPSGQVAVGHGGLGQKRASAEATAPQFRLTP